MKKKSVSTKTKKTSISIGVYYQDIIDREVKSGKYGSVSEVIRAGLRLLEKEELKAYKTRNNKKQQEKR